MTPPHPSPLVERVAEAIRAAAYGDHACMDDQRRSQALAAVRVVVEAAAEVCCQSDSYATFGRASGGMALAGAATRILALLPSEPEA